jgi:hypothetical protein
MTDPIDTIIDSVIATLRANRDKVVSILQQDPGGISSTHRQLEDVFGDVRNAMQRNYHIGRVQ